MSAVRTVDQPPGSAEPAPGAGAPRPDRPRPDRSPRGLRRRVISWLSRYEPWVDLRRAWRGMRPRDRSSTLWALLLCLGGLAALGYLMMRDEPLSRDWCWMWVGAVAAIITGVVVGAPVFRGRTLVAAVMLGLVLAGATLVQLGIHHLFDLERESARDTASLLAYLVWDPPPPQSSSGPNDENVESGNDGRSEAEQRAETAVENLCTMAGGVLDLERDQACMSELEAADAPTPPKGAPAVMPATETRQLFVARAAAQLATADLQLARALADDQASEADTSAARSAQAQARDALQTAEQVTRLDVAQALSAGTGVIVDGLLENESQFPLAAGIIVWTLGAAAVVGLIRWTSVRNSTRGLGPVSFDVPEKDQDWEPCAERFRIHLLDNVPEPGSVPNAETLSEVASLVGTAVPNAAGSSRIVADALESLRSAILVERGYAVQVAVVRRPDVETAETAPSPAATTSAGGADSKGSNVKGLVARVRKSRTGALMEQREFPFLRDTDREVTVREAALWAAAVIISDSRSVPGWARWSPDACRPLARLGQARRNAGARPDEKASGDGGTLETVGVAELEEAIRLSPESGRLLLELAHTEEQAGNFEAALGLTLDAVSFYPRYLDARYRLACEAGLWARELDGHQEDEGHPTRETSNRRMRNLDRLHSAVLRHLGDEHPLAKALHAYQNAPGGDAARRLADELQRLSLRERERERRRRWPVVLAWNAMHATERDLWLPVLWQHRRRSDLQRRVKSAKLVTLRQRNDKLRQRHDRENEDEQPKMEQLERERQRLERRAERLCKQAERCDVIWQVPYNLACYYAAAGSAKDLETAKGLLERARMAREGSQLSREWVDSDPDLKPLHAQDGVWWDQFLERCRSGSIRDSE
jgi:hypothetical protein